MSSSDENSIEPAFDASSSDEEGWIECENASDDESDDVKTKCFFCPMDIKNTDDSYSEALTHLTNEHQFDLKLLKSQLAMDQYSFIKMVNYIRANKCEAKEFTEASQIFWDDPKYLKPEAFENWLTFDFDGLEAVNVAGAIVANTAEQTIQALQLELNEKNGMLQEAAKNIEDLREKIKTIIENDNSFPVVADGISNANVDDGYFGSYSHYDIHHEMLSDKIRTESYRDAIMKNRDLIKNKIVLDVGCGTGILSMFAAKAGAESVISIDQAEIIYQAMDIAKKNHIKNIKFVKGRIEDKKLPVEKVDFIISEWMGYFLLFEGMLDSVIYARDNYLKPDGLMLPNYCNLKIIGYGDTDRHEQYISFWKNVYGFNMSTILPYVLRTAVVENCNPRFTLTESNTIAEFDLMTVDRNCPNFSYNFSLLVTRTGRLTAFVGFFDTDFRLPHPIHFSTGPNAVPTHWKQMVFYLKDPVTVTVNETIEGRITCRRDINDLRALVVQINAFGQTIVYNIN